MPESEQQFFEQLEFVEEKFKFVEILEQQPEQLQQSVVSVKPIVFQQ